VVEGARLESVFRGNSNVGSNPTLSAKCKFFDRNAQNLPWFLIDERFGSFWRSQVPGLPLVRLIEQQHFEHRSVDLDVFALVVAD
jgi:hypothetical protein